MLIFPHKESHKVLYVATAYVRVKQVWKVRQVNILSCIDYTWISAVFYNYILFCTHTQTREDVNF